MKWSLTDATLDSLAINATMDNGTIDVSIDSVADVTLTGQLAVVGVTPDGSDNARYTALKMGDVTVTTSTTSADFGLTGVIDINRLDYNGVEGDFDRLDWSTRTQPGADLPTPVDLTIDYNREFIHRIVGSVTGNGGTGTTTGSRTGNHQWNHRFCQHPLSHQ